MGRRVMQRPFYVSFAMNNQIRVCIILFGEVQLRIAFITDISASAGTRFQKSVAWHLMSPEPDTLAETRFACKSEANRSPEPATR